jgi:(R,R)-butanediol dehydrogenase/meso-butanediol dehydrogenase/diacetyl reductase
MKAALFMAPGQPLVIEEIPDPEPQPEEVVLKVARCGVCGTDLHATSGHGRPLTPRAQLGHEFAGEVVALGKGVERLKVGDFVAGLPVIGCGECECCRTGIDILCRQWTSYGKALAEYVRLPERGGVVLPPDVSPADSALIEPLAVARRGVRLAAPSPDTRVLVIGPGPIGLSVIFWLRRLGVRNVAVLASSGRRRRLAEAMGTDAFVLESDDGQRDIEKALGGAPELVVEAAGVPGTVSRAIQLVRPQGTVVALGFCTSPEPIVPAAALMKDVTLRFSITYTREDYVACAEALRTDAARARSMVTDVVSLTDFPAAFEAFRAGRSGGGKLLCDPWLAP